MTDEVVIRVENLGKKYRLQHQAQRQRYTALRDVIAEKAKGLFQKLKFGRQKAERQRYVALRDIITDKLKSPFRWLKKSPLRLERGEEQGEVSKNFQLPAINHQLKSKIFGLRKTSRLKCARAKWWGLLACPVK
jgi:hypothetical protein